MKVQVAVRFFARAKSFSFPLCSVLDPVRGVSMHNLRQINYSVRLNIKMTLPDSVNPIPRFWVRISRPKEVLDSLPIARVSVLKAFTIMKDKPWIFYWSIWRFYFGFPRTVMCDINILGYSVSRPMEVSIWVLSALLGLCWRHVWWGTTCQRRSGGLLAWDIGEERHLTHFQQRGFGT